MQFTLPFPRTYRKLTHRMRYIGCWFKARSAAPPARRPWKLEALEPRVLLSATPVPEQRHSDTLAADERIAPPSPAFAPVPGEDIFATRGGGGGTVSPAVSGKDLMGVTLEVLDTNGQPITGPITRNFGDTVSVRYTVTNNGDTTITESWFDDFVLSTDTTIGYQADGSLTFRNRTADLAPGASYTDTISVQLNKGGSLFLGLDLDSNNQVTEADEANNDLSIPITVNQPDIDLVATLPAAPATAAVATTVALGFRVTNGGTVATTANNWTDAFYLSTDGVFDRFNDLFLTSAFHSGAVAAGGGYNANASVRIPDIANGNYTLFFVADRFSPGQAETSETNNVVSLPITITGAVAADLRVSNILLSRNGSPVTSASLGGPLDVTYTVTNHGTETASADWLDRIYLSRTGSRTQIGSHFVSTESPLAPGSSYTVTKSVTMLTSGGTGSAEIYIATDDDQSQAETNGQNNFATTPITLTQGNLPDLTISQLTVTPSTVNHGANVTVDFTVTNTGSAAASGSVQVGYFLSSNNTISFADDTFLTNASISLGTLAAGASATFSKVLTVNGLVTGSNFVLAQVDYFSSIVELSEANNVGSAAVTVITPDVDLAVTSVSAPATAIVGSEITVTGRVINNGSVSATASWSDQLYLSTDAVYSSNDLFVRSFFKDSSTGAPGTTYEATQFVTLPDSPAPGNYFLIYRANPSGDQGETNYANNTRAVPITLTSSSVDLVVTSFVAPATAGQGQTIMLTWTVTNQGTAATDAGWFDSLDLYNGFSYLTGNSFSTSSLTPLAPGASYTITRPFEIPSNAPLATLELRLEADGFAEQHESSNTNNKFSRMIAITEGSRADLVAQNASAPATANVGQSIAYSFQVRNDGSGPTLQTWSDGVYLSRDTTFDSGDALVASVSSTAHPLAASGLYTVDGTLTIPSGYGGFNYLLFVADGSATALETIEDNNTVSRGITISGPDVTASDLAIPAMADLGQTVPISYTLSNVGNAASPGNWQAVYYISDDTTLNFGDTQIDSQTLPSLEVSSSITVTRNIVLGSARTGAVYLLVKVNSSELGETILTNNVAAAPITLSGADLEILPAVTAPANAVVGQSVTATYTVKNSGQLAATAARTDGAYISDDALWDQNDLLAASFVVPAGSLAPGGTAEYTRTFNIPGNAANGSKHLVFKANIYGEQREGSLQNNAASSPIALSAPNLTVSNFTAPATARIGESIPLSWTVTNSGTVDVLVPFDDLIYLSTDVVVSAGDTFVGQESRLAGFTLAAGASQVVTRSFTMPASVSGAVQLLLKVDGSAPGLTETNEGDNVIARAITLLSPNLVVQNLTVPASVMTGQTFTVTWQTANLGNAATAGGFQERITVRRTGSGEIFDTRLVNFDSALAAAGTAGRSITLTLPDGDAAVGQLEVTVETDSNNNVIEGSGNEANIASQSVTATLAAYPDLQVSAITLPATLKSGQTVTVGWTVLNAGNGAASTLWGDTILAQNLTTGQSLFSSGTTHNPAVAGTLPLGPGQAETREATFTLPDGFAGAGNLRFTVVTDASGQLFEYNAAGTAQTNNSRVVDAVSALAPYAELQVANLALPANLQSGQTVTLTWNTRNAGTGATAGNFSDTVEIFNVTTGQSIRTAVLSWVQADAGNGSIAAGTVRARQFSFMLPDGAAGTGQIRATVQTDSTNAIREYDAAGAEAEGNNQSAVTGAAVLANYPDLQVSAVLPPGGLASGQQGRVLQWTVANAGNKAVTTGWSDRVRITNTVTGFVIADTTLAYDVAASGNGPLAAGGTLNRFFTFNLPAGNDGYGNLSFEVTTDAGNAVLEIRPGGIDAEANNATSVTATAALSASPDLVVTTITAPPDALSNQDVEFIWTVKNQGSAATPLTGWTDRLWLSADNIPSGDDLFIGSFGYSGVLEAGEEVERIQSFHLPVLFQGTRRLLVVTDATGSVLEANLGRTAEANNLGVDDATLAVTLSPFPNLVVTNVTGPAQANSGQPSAVTWTVRNIGQAATSGLWRDSIYLSSDLTWDPTDFFLKNVDNEAALPVGEGYNNSAMVTLPDGINGTYYFIVRGDISRNLTRTDVSYNSEIIEENENDNNRASTAANVTLTPPPDLRVTVNASSLVFSGQSVPLSFTVTNHGPGRTAVGRWTDTLFLSTDNTLDGGDSTLGSFTHAPTTVRTSTQSGGQTSSSEFETGGFLEAGESYTVTAQVRVPVGVAGEFHFLAQTDAGGAVYEQALDGNNVGADPVTIVLTPPPDLEVAGITLPAGAEASRPFTLQYRVENNGATVTPDNDWFDSLWLSADGALDGGDLHLGNVRHFGSLEAGAGYDGSATFTLPNALTGSFRVIVRTDTPDKVFELDNGNNIAVSAGTLAVSSNPADLQMIGSSLGSATAQAGGTLRVNWTVGNFGAGDTVVDSWTDEVFITTATTLDGSERRLGSFQRRGVLNPGETYFRSEVLALPLDLQGSFNIFIRSDTGNSVFESGPAANNVAGPLAVNVGQQIADLQVIAASSAPNALSGQSLTVGWTVKNNGNGPTNLTDWHDRVILSTTPNLSGVVFEFRDRPRHSGRLEAGESYNTSRTFTLPIDLVGNYFVIVETNVPEGLSPPVFEGANAGSNAGVAGVAAGAGSPMPTNITLGPVPDLVISSVNAPGEIVSGQPFTVTWSVANSGGIAAGGSWFESFYLSRDRVLDTATDTFVGSARHEGGLAAGASYAGSAELLLSRGLSGSFFLFGVADSTDRVYERDAERNNRGLDLSPTLVTLAPPADLDAGTVTIPATAQPGQDATVFYTVTNVGQNIAKGSWTDSLYLSRDGLFGLDDILFGRVAHNGDIAPGASYTGSITAPLPGVVPGDYRIIVRSDIRDQVNESSETNNLEASGAAIAVNIPSLTLGAAQPVSLTSGRTLFYKVTVPAGEALLFSLDSSDDSFSNQLFVAQGRVPTVADHDFSFAVANGADQEITVPSSVAGEYYVMVRTVAGSAVNPGTLKVEAIPFGVRRIDLASVGNAGPATLELTGARYTAATQFALVGPGGEVLPATRVVFQNSSVAYATFDLTGKALGTYDVRATTPGGSTATLNDTLAVNTGLGGRIAAEFTGPGAVRPARQYIAYIEVANFGDADAGVPAFILVNHNAIPVGLDADEQTTQRLLHFVAADDDLLGGVLRPGERKNIPIFFTAGGQPSFSLIVLRPGDPTPIDWTIIRKTLQTDGLAPEGLSPAAFELAFARLQVQVGSTWGDYVGMLGRNATVLPGVAGVNQDARPLLALEFRRAIAATGSSITGTLTRTTFDVAVGGQLVVATNTATGASQGSFSLKDGTFIFERLAAGSYTIEVDRALVISGGTATVAAALPRTGVSVAIERGAVVSGRVSAEGTSPVQLLSGALLRLRGADGALFVATTGTDGRYLFTGLRPGTYLLEAEAAGRARTALGTVVIASTSDTLARNASLAAESVVRGTVLFQAGGPASTLAVVAASLADPADKFRAGVADRTYSLNNLSAGTYRVTFSAEGYFPVTLDTTVAAGQTLVLPSPTLLRSATIGGTLVSSDPERAAAGVLIGAYQGTAIVATAPVNSAGGYVVKGLAPGTYTLKAIDGMADFGTTAEITVAAGQDVTGVALRLLPGGVITGVVRSTVTNRPVAGASVSLSNLGGPLLTAVTGADGRYTFERLALGAYTTFVRAGGSASADTTVTSLAGTATVANFQVAFTASLGGTLALADGTPVAGIVTLFENGQRITAAQTDATGRFLFLLDRGGNFTIEPVSGSATFPALAPVTVAPGDVLEQAFVAGTGSLSISVTGGAGAGVLVTHVTPGGRRLLAGEATVRPDGTATLPNLAPGIYEIFVAGENDRGARGTATVAGTGTTAATLAMVQLGSVAGTVTGPGGLPIAGAHLVLRSSATGDLIATAGTARDGTYRFSYVPAGDYAFSVVAAGFQTAAPAAITVGATAVTRHAALAVSTTILRGLVVNAQGEPLRAGNVVVVDAAGRFVGSTGLQHDGSWVITSAAGSGLAVRILTDGFEHALLANVTAPAGQNTLLGTQTLASVSSGVSGLGSPGAVSPAFGEQGGEGLFSFLRTVLERVEKDNDHVSFGDVPEPCSPEAASQTISERLRLLDAIGFEEGYFDILRDRQDILRTETALLIGAWLASTIDTTAQIVGVLASVLPLGAVISKAGAAIRGVKIEAAVADAAADALKRRNDFAEAAGLFLNVINNLRTIVENLATVKVSFLGIMDADSPADAAGRADQVVAEANALFGLLTDLGPKVAKLLATPAVATAIGDALGAAAIFGGPLGVVASLPGLMAGIQGNVMQLRGHLQGVKDSYEAFKDTSDFYDKWVGNANKRLTEYIFALEKADCDPDDPREDDEEEEADDKAADDGKGSPWSPLDPFAPGSPFGPGGPFDPDRFVPPFIPPLLISRDPNDIIGPIGFGAEKWVGVDQRLDYTIRFENAATTSGAAQEVTVTQFLDPDLDWRTFRLDDFSFGDIRIDLPGTQSFYSGRIDLLAERGYVVDVFAFIDVQTGKATWRLATLDPATGEKPEDAALGFLPPNDDAHIGEGFVSYSVRASRTAPTGAALDAEADIVFDINEPIITPAITNKLDSTRPVSAVETIAEPVGGEGQLLVKWDGSDIGAGVANFDVYVSRNGASFEVWLAKTVLLEATYPGVTGDQYRFFTVARDNAGNVQAANPGGALLRAVSGQSNAIPVLQGDRTLSISEDGLLTPLNIAAPTDADGDPLIISVTTLPDGTKGIFRRQDGTTLRAGTLLSLSELAGVTYTPAPNANGPAGAFAYTVTDGRGGSGTQTVSLNLTAVNDAPAVQADRTLTRLEDSALVNLGIASPTDPDNDTLAITVGAVPSASHGTVRRADGSTVAPGAALTLAELAGLTWNPALNANGAAGTFSYTVNDGRGGTATQVITLNLTAVNDAPLAQLPRTVTVAEDSAPANLAITIPTDVDGDTLTITVNTVPAAAKGSVKLANGTVIAAGMFLTAADLAGVIFTPALNANGAAGTFSYSVGDGNGGIAAQTLTLQITPVNDAPVTNAAKTITILEDAAAAPLGLSAPTDVDGDALSLTVTALPLAGKGAVRLADGTAVAAGQALTAGQLSGLTFLPALNANGSAGVFSYTAADGQGGVTPGSVEFVLTAVNDAPVANANKTITVLEDSGPTPLAITAPTDVDGDALTLTVTAVPSSKGQLRLADGTLVTQGTTLTTAQLPGLIFSPTLNANGLAGTFAYSVTDGSGGTAQQTVSFAITSVNDTPVAAANTTLTVSEDSAAAALGIAAPTDVDGDALAITVTTLPTAAAGTVRLADGTVVANGSTLSLAQLAGLTFTPALNANGAAGAFSYTVQDGQGGSAGSAVTIAITPVNDAPVAEGDKTLTVLEDSGTTSVAIPLPTDVDGDTLTATITGLTGTSSGRVRLADGTVLAMNATITAAQLAGLTYTPNLNFNGPGGAFRYTLSDGQGGNISRTVTFTVTSVNDLPVVDAVRTLTVLEDSAPTLLGIAAPTDVESSTLTIAVTGVPNLRGEVRFANGTALTEGMLITSAELQALSFVPAANANGAAGQFSYRVTDGSGGFSDGLVNLAITSVNDAPSAEGDRATTRAEDSAPVPLAIASPTDVESDALAATVTSLPSALHGTIHLPDGTAVPLGGTLTIAQLRTLLFTPVPNANGAAGTFSYTVNDGNGGSDTASIVFGLTAVNDIPVVEANKTVTMAEDSGPTPLAITPPTDADGDTLIVAIGSVPATGAGRLQLADGTAVRASMQITPAQLAGITFTPALNFNGAAGTFTYTVEDGSGGSRAQSITLVVTPVNDAPIVSGAGTFQLVEDSPATALGLIAPTDVESDALTLTTIALPLAAAGVVRLADGTAITSSQVLTASQLTSLTFTPAANFFGSAGTLAYIATDSAGASTTFTLNLAVNGVNDAPDAQADKSLSMVAGEAPLALGITLPVDLDGDALIVFINGLPNASRGAITLADGTPITMETVLSTAQLPGLRFVPVAGFIGTTSFSYAVTDAAGSRDVQVITFTVTRQILAFTKSFSFLDADGDKVTVAIGGNGSGEVELVSGLATGSDLLSLRLSGTDAKTSLRITVAKGGTRTSPTPGLTTVGSVSTTATQQNLGSVTLGKNVLLGNGAADATPELFISGSLKSLVLDDLAASAMIRLGAGFAANSSGATALKPAITLGDVLGFDASVGVQGGIAKLTVGSWDHFGLVTTLGSIGSLTSTRGNFRASLRVDAASAHIGTATLGAVNVKGGALAEGEITVEGAITSLTAKGPIRDTAVSAASLGPIKSAGLANASFAAATGSIGKITSAGAIDQVSITALAGTIGNITATVKNAVGAANAISSLTVEAQAVGKVNGTVSGAGLTAGAGITDSSVRATAGAIAGITATATSGAVTADLVGLRDSLFQATTSMGAIVATASLTNRASVGGSAIALQARAGEALSLTAGTLIASLKATATGGALRNIAALSEAGSLGPVTITAGTTLGAVKFTASQVRGLGAQTTAIAGAKITAGTSIASFTASTDRAGDSVRDLRLVSGGRLGGLTVKSSAIDGGTIAASTVLAGQATLPGTAAAQAANGIKKVTIAGSLLNTTLASSGSIGAVKITGNAAGSRIIAGVNAGTAGDLGTADDLYQASASIARFQVVGALSLTTIAAGINPGADGFWGSADDTLGSASSGAALGKIGAIRLGALTAAAGPTPLFLPATAPGSQQFGILAPRLTSLTVGTITQKDFTLPLVLDANRDNIAQSEELLIRQIGT